MKPNEFKRVHVADPEMSIKREWCRKLPFFLHDFEVKSFKSQKPENIFFKAFIILDNPVLIHRKKNLHDFDGNIHMFFYLSSCA